MTKLISFEKMNMQLSIITVNYNSLIYTREFLTSLYPFLQKNWEVIVVDNASRENEATLLQEQFPWVKSIRSEQNLGFAGGNNLGVKYAKGDYYFFINNDVIITEDCFSLLLQRMETDYKVAAISPKIVNQNGSFNYLGCDPLDTFLMHIHYRTQMNVTEQISGETPLIHGAAVMIRRTALEAVGGWSESFFLYAEEIDLSLHLKRQGYILWYEPDVELVHIGSCSTGKNSPLVCYYNSRNRLLLYKRNLLGWKRHYAIIYHLMITVPHNMLIYLLRKDFDLLYAYWNGVVDFILSRFGKRRF